MLGPVRHVRHLGRYRQIVRILVRHGLGAIVDQLGLTPLLNWPQRLRRQPPTPPQTLAERVRQAIEELGPTFIKLGQVLSTRPDLIPPDLLAELNKLQDEVPPAPWEAVYQVLQDAYGRPPEEVFLHIETTPLGSASLAQVYAATLPDGSEVVVKVQRPGIRHTIDIDLEILRDIARLAQERTALGEIYDLVEIVDEFAFTLRGELDYIREARNAERLRHNMAPLGVVYIPRVYWEYTSERVIVMERIRGIKIDDVEGLRKAGLNPQKVILNAAEMIVKQALVDGFFHADPHPGNFYVLENNVIGVMDFGIVGYLSDRVREDLIRLFIVSVLMDVEGIVDQLLRMSVVHQAVDRARLRRDVERILVRYYGLPLKYIRARDVINDLLPIVYRHRLGLPTDLWLLGKTLMMWEGLTYILYPDFDFFAVADPYVRRFLRQSRAPRAIARRTATTLNQWISLVAETPARLRPILLQMERGQWEVRTREVTDPHYLSMLDRAISRLSIALLLAALIIGFGMVLPSLDLTWPWSLTTWLVMPGFMSMFVLSLWWLWNTLRGGKK